MSIHELIDTIKQTFENDSRVKICHKYNGNRALQIQMQNGDNFNLCIVKLDKKAYIIKRYNEQKNNF